MIKNIEEVLKERNTTHGGWALQAYTTNKLKLVMRNSQNWPDLDPSKQEVLDMLATKIGRILSGDPNEADHWDDMAGYLELERKEQKKVVRPPAPIQSQQFVAEIHNYTGE